MGDRKEIEIARREQGEKVETQVVEVLRENKLLRAHADVPLGDLEDRLSCFLLDVYRSDDGGKTWRLDMFSSADGGLFGRREPPTLQIGPNDGSDTDERKHPLLAPGQTSAHYKAIVQKYRLVPVEGEYGAVIETE